VSAETDLRRIFEPGCVATDGPVTLRRPLEQDPEAFYDRANGQTVAYVRSVGDALGNGSEETSLTTHGGKARPQRQRSKLPAPKSSMTTASVVQQEERGGYAYMLLPSQSPSVRPAGRATYYSLHLLHPKLRQRDHISRTRTR
jgi:hypothetical protein